jgi:hypothetical protein
MSARSFYGDDDIEVEADNGFGISVDGLAAGDAVAAAVLVE